MNAASNDHDGGGGIHFDDEFVLVVDRNQPDVEPLCQLIDRVHTLYARSFLSYLAEWEPYTDAKTVRLRTLARKISKANNDHMFELAQLLESFGRVAHNRSFNKHFADENYTTWSYILPTLVEMMRRQIITVERVLEAITDLPGEERARPVLQEQLETNRAFFADLEKHQA